MVLLKGVDKSGFRYCFDVGKYSHLVFPDECQIDLQQKLDWTQFPVKNEKKIIEI